jgi:hypothetical protein
MAALAACAAGGVGEKTVAAPKPPPYGRPEGWVCRPDLPTDPCREDLDATLLRPDGTQAPLPHVAAARPLADCFYVYPTVDFSAAPGNHTDVTDNAKIVEVTHAQAARFTSVCRMFVPLYRQMTISSYLAPKEQYAEYFERAYQDVLTAFRYYQAHFDVGRGIVLLGHSQGAQMVSRLMQEVFDGDPATRARLLVGMPIGGDVDVATGSLKGGTFRNIPLCSSAGELGCVVAYATHVPESVAHPWPRPPRDGRSTACVNPAALGQPTTKARLAGAVFPTRSRFRDVMPGSDWAKTPFIELRDYYSAWCVERPDGFRYLTVAAEPDAGDTRKGPIDLKRRQWRELVAGYQLGLHVLDYQFAQEDLIKLVERKAAAFAERRLAR